MFLGGVSENRCPSVKVCNAEDRSAKSVSAFAEHSGATSKLSVKGEMFEQGGVLEGVESSTQSVSLDWKFRESFPECAIKNSDASVTGMHI
jgi:hypothetical protein